MNEKYSKVKNLEFISYYITLSIALCGVLSYDLNNLSNKPL